MLEKDIKRSINRYLDKIPDLIHFPYSAYMGGVAGVSDIICCWRGLFIAIEVKRKGNTQTLKQKAFADSVTETGGTYILAYGVDEVKAFFKKMDAIDERMWEHFREIIKGD